MPANRRAATGLAGEGPREGAMTTLLKPRETQTPIEGVKQATRPAAPTSAVKIEEEYHDPGTFAGAAKPHRRLIRVQAGVPSPRRKGVWSAVLAIINGPAVTQRADQGERDTDQVHIPPVLDGCLPAGAGVGSLATRIRNSNMGPKPFG